MPALRIPIFSAVLCLMASAPVYAGAVEKACLRSGQSSASKSLCKCIDTTARKTLGFSHQNTAAQLILRPERSEKMRQSPRSRDRQFWAAYTKFARTAERRCK